MNMRQQWAWLPLIIFTLLAVLLGLGLLTRQQERPSARLALPFPAFSLPELDNKSITHGPELFVGHVTLVNVWGSWCPSCEQEIPELLQLRRDGVHIVGVIYRDEREDAQGFLARHGNPYDTDILDTDGRLSFDLGVYGAPETFIVDTRGVIRYHHAGELTTTLIEHQVRPLLRELAHET